MTTGTTSLRAGTVARLLRDSPPALHGAILDAASTCEARFSLTREPLVGGTGTKGRAAVIARDLSVALDVGRERVRVAPVDLHAFVDSLVADLAGLGHELAVDDSGRVAGGVPAGGVAPRVPQPAGERGRSRRPGNGAGRGAATRAAQA